MWKASEIWNNLFWRELEFLNASQIQGSEIQDDCYEYFWESSDRDSLHVPDDNWSVSSSSWIGPVISAVLISCPFGKDRHRNGSWWCLRSETRSVIGLNETQDCSNLVFLTRLLYQSHVKLWTCNCDIRVQNFEVTRFKFEKIAYQYNSFA